MEKPKFNFTASINDALSGSMDAYEFLYRKSLPVFEKVVYEYCSNPNDVDDILQEAYIKIFSNLGSLKNANSFLAWGSQICKNEAINAGKKKEEQKNDFDLLPDTSDDEGSMGMDEVSADTYSTDFNPEAKIDASETKRLMDEMLGELTENQRLVICMWKDQYTFKEIAEELGMPENTVKSHFNRGKKALETKVKDLEKKGTKLYEMAPFPFFLWIMHQFDQHYTPDVSPEYSGSLLKDVVDQLPEHAIDVTKSTPTSIEKYGTSAMKKEAGQLHVERGGTNSKPDTTYRRSGNVPSPEEDSTLGNASAEGLENNQKQISETESQINNHETVPQQQDMSEYTTSSNDAKGTAAAGDTIAKADATTSGMSTTARVIIIAAVALIGIGGIIGFLASRNGDEDVVVQIDESDDQNDTEERGSEASKGPLFTQEEAGSMTSQEIAEVLDMEYIGNEFDESDSQISDLPEGCISAYAHDFDGDGENEVLIVKTSSDNGSQTIGISIYELEGNDWIEAAERMEEIPGWDSLKVRYDEYGYQDGDLLICYLVVDDTIYISNPSLIYGYYDFANSEVELEVSMITYSNGSFQEGITTDFSERKAFSEGGFNLVTAMYSYYNTDLAGMTGYYAESYIVNLVDYMNMSSYTVGNYEFSYPKYFDKIGIQMVTGTTDTGHDLVTANLINSNIYFPDYYEGVENGKFLLFDMYNGNYSENDLYALDADVFWKSGDQYWGFGGGEYEGDRLPTNAAAAAEDISMFPIFNEYRIAFYSYPEIRYYFHSLGN